MEPLNPTKPRESYIYIGSSEPFTQFHYDQNEDSVSLPNDGRTYYLFHQREYPREKKPKIIYALFQFFGSSTIKKDPLEELRKYDRVFAIDTNYNELAVTTVVVGDWPRFKYRLNFRVLSTEAFAPMSETPEREAWRSFIETYPHDLSQRYALIVDSELGSLIKINRRETPVFEDFFLPENWQLNYATSDVNDEFVTVRMMKECDSSNRRFRSKL